MTIMRRSLRKSLVASHQTCPATAANAPSSHLEPQTRFSFFAYFPIERYKISGEKTKQSILLPPFYSMYIYQSIYTEYRVYWHIRLVVEQRLQAGRIRRTGEKKKTYNIASAIRISLHSTFHCLTVVHVDRISFG
jgi:hypothetical protein